MVWFLFLGFVWGDDSFFLLNNVFLLCVLRFCYHLNLFIEGVVWSLGVF